MVRNGRKTPRQSSCQPTSAVMRRFSSSSCPLGSAADGVAIITLYSYDPRGSQVLPFWRISKMADGLSVDKRQEANAALLEVDKGQ